MLIVSGKINNALDSALGDRILFTLVYAIETGRLLVSIVLELIRRP